MQVVHATLTLRRRGSQFEPQLTIIPHPLQFDKTSRADVLHAMHGPLQEIRQVPGHAALIDHSAAAALVVDVGGGSTELSWVDLRDGALKRQGDRIRPDRLPIRAWLSVPVGVVTLAEPDLFYSGGTVFLDHGYRLSSAFLHMSKVLVRVGQELQAGDLIGEIGASGRATGPHLDWRMNWRNRRIDPQLLAPSMPLAPVP